MDFTRESQGFGCYGNSAKAILGERKLMKKLVFLLAGAAALSLAGCNRNNQDEVQNAELNQPAADQLNALSSEAANDAANAEAASLGNQQQQNQNVVQDNTVNPSDAQEQNVSGM
jgi:hypothetical protein